MENRNLSENAMKVASSLKKNGYEVFVVGGAVRDFCLGVTPHDIDFATNATPDEIEKCMEDCGIFTTDVGKKYGTIVAHLGGEEFEVTTYRKEQGYADGRHPEVTYASTIEEDLSRRDFTMNAMAMDPFSGEITDPFDGMEDIRAKVLSFVGNTKDRITEDSLRIVRALRFAVKYNLSLTEKDKSIIKENVDLMKNLSKERKTEELKKILTCNKLVKDVFLEFSEVLFQIVPELEPTYNCSQKNKYHQHDVYEHILSVVDFADTDKFEIKLACLLHDIGKPASKVSVEDSKDGFEHFYGHPKVSAKIAEQVFENSLVLTNKEKELVLSLVEHHDTNFFQTEKQLRKAIVKFGEPFLRDLVVLQSADMADHVIPPDMTEEKKRKWHIPNEEIEAMFDNIHKKSNCFSLRDLAVKGNDLVELGYEGPEIGATLKEMLNLVAEESLPNERDALLQYAESEKRKDCEEPEL